MPLKVWHVPVALLSFDLVCTIGLFKRFLVLNILSCPWYPLMQACAPEHEGAYHMGISSGGYLFLAAHPGRGRFFRFDLPFALREVVEYAFPTAELLRISMFPTQTLLAVLSNASETHSACRF